MEVPTQPRTATQKPGLSVSLTLISFLDFVGDLSNCSCLKTINVTVWVALVIVRFNLESQKKSLEGQNNLAPCGVRFSAVQAYVWQYTQIRHGGVKLATATYPLT